MGDLRPQPRRRALRPAACPSRRARRPWRRQLVGTAAACLLGAAPGHAAPSPQDVRALASLSIEDLMAVEVTSLSKRPEPQFRAAAAVYVLTGQDLERAGVTSLPDALRLVPGVQVEQVSASQWSVGIRGFGNTLSRAMLVLIDGRSVYNPLFAGVFWDEVDVLIADIERIEVIRGPGGTVWGANAVNGVVNIVTRPAADTTGHRLEVGIGTALRATGSYRHGTALGPDTHLRGYARYTERGPLANRFGPEFDDWGFSQAGFRADWDGRADQRVTVQGDAYHGRLGAQTSASANRAPFVRTLDPINDAEALGANVLARWEGRQATGASWRLQGSYAHAERHEELYTLGVDSVDLDFSRRHAPRGRHTLEWGGGYRFVNQQSGGERATRFVPDSRADALWSLFLQDDIALVPDRVGLTVGSKFEHNDYSGFEFQPSVRAWWAPAQRHFLWASATRAVRTPSRFEHDLELTTFAPAFGGFVRLSGDESFDAERTHAYELGYRYASERAYTIDVAAFYNEFRDLLTFELGTPFVETSPAPAHVIVPAVFANQAAGSAHGVEIAARWAPTDRWQVDLSYAYTQLDLRPTSASAVPSTITSVEDGAPHHAASLRAHVELAPDWSTDFVLRYVDTIAAAAVPAYTELDWRLAWRVSPGFTLEATGRNLLDAQHPERSGTGLEVERSALLRAIWNW